MSAFLDHLPEFWEGLIVTLQLIAASFAGAVVVGVAITGTLTAGMATLAAPSYLNNLVLGILLVLLLVADFLIIRATRRRRLQRLRTIVAAEGEVPAEALTTSGR